MSAKNLELDPFLGPYNYGKKKIWQDSTNFVTKKFLSKIQNTSKKIVKSEYKESERMMEREMEDVNDLASNKNLTKFRHSKKPALSRDEYDRRLKELMNLKDVNGVSKLIEEFEGKKIPL